jgi:predicted DNA-binding mobile mystery protein A
LPGFDRFRKPNARPKAGCAIRNALGMTTAQLVRRVGVSQPRIVELEKSEVSGSVTLRSLQRAAEALNCRFVYALVPEKPLAEAVRDRADRLAAHQLAAVEHTMRLENQTVKNKTAHDDLHQTFVDELMRRPARLWDEK